MVAGVEGGARLSAEGLLLPLGLRAAGPGEEAAGGDALVLERAVVRAAVERRVRLGRDVSGLLFPQPLDVVAGADEADLLRPPEREADLVAGLRVEPRELERHLQHRRRPRAVVVDAGTLRHGVQVRPDHHGVVPVAPRRLGYDVGGARLPALGHGDARLRRLPARQQTFPERCGGANPGYADAGTAERAAQHLVLVLARVEYERRRRAGSLRVFGLCPERAGAA